MLLRVPLRRGYCNTVGARWSTGYGWLVQTLVRRIALGFVVATLVAVLAGWWSQASLRAAVAANEAVVGSAAFLNAIDRLLLPVIEAETSMRGFAVTGDAIYLAPYERALARFDVEAATLRERTEAAPYSGPLDDVVDRFGRWEREQAGAVVAARRQSPAVLINDGVAAYGSWLGVEALHASIARASSVADADVQAWLARLDDVERAVDSVLLAPIDAAVREPWAVLAGDVRAYRLDFTSEGVPDLDAIRASERVDAYADVAARFETAWGAAMRNDANVSELLLAGAGRELVPSIRETLDAIRVEERQRLGALQQLSVSSRTHSVLMAWLAPIGAVVISLAMVVAFIGQLGRHVARFESATRALAAGAAVPPIGARGPPAMRAFTRDFDRMAADVMNRDREAGLMAHLAAMAQAARSMDEAMPAITEVLARMLPDASGALWLVNESRDELRRATGWGDVVEAPDHVDLDGCWGLRQGKPYVASGASAIRCAHDPQHEGTTTCVPLVSRDETLGILTVRSEAPTDATDDDGRGERTVRRVAEQLALAVSNLRLREALEQLSIRDPLTGLFNRRFLEQSLVLEIARAVRTRQPLSVVMVDVDHFKRFNDDHGHDAGDAVLRNVGRVLAERIRVGDIACRFGGEEFLLVLPGADEQIVAQRAETVRSDIEAMVVVHAGTRLPNVTASIGVATSTGTTMTSERLLRWADEALYAAKEGGRNRVCISEPEGVT
ncbi:hypothetical protein BH23DEI1_BH23DEI1_18270 [soil metagenome]